MCCEIIPTIGGMLEAAVTICFGRVVRELRLEARMSQERLGAVAGLQRNYISSLELGHKQPSLLTIFKLASALNLRADLLISKTVDLMSQGTIGSRSHAHL